MPSPHYLCVRRHCAIRLLFIHTENCRCVHCSQKCNTLKHVRSQWEKSCWISLMSTSNMLGMKGCRIVWWPAEGQIQVQGQSELSVLPVISLAGTTSCCHAVSRDNGGWREDELRGPQRRLVLASGLGRCAFTNEKWMNWKKDVGRAPKRENTV